MWGLPVKPRVCPLMKALSTAWQPHLQSFCMYQSVRGRTAISLPCSPHSALWEVPLCHFCLLPSWAAWICHQNHIREMRAVQHQTLLAQALKYFLRRCPRSALFSSLAVVAMPCSPVWVWSPGTPRAELPLGLCVQGHTGLSTASWAM